MRALLILGLAACAAFFIPGCVATAPVPFDQLSAVSLAANELAPYEPRPQWQSSLTSIAVDLLLYLDEQRVLVGTLSSPEVHALPQHGPLSLVNTSTGKVLWAC